MKTTLILASQSLRRRQLLEQAGYAFEVIPSQVDESTFDPTGTSPAEYACRLAQAKALDVSQDYPDRWVLGADTLIDFHGEVIGKPVDYADAERITRKIFSAPHRVITGLALVHCTRQVERMGSDVTMIYPRSWDEAQLQAHLASGTWQDKAGAYAIQETGDALIERWEGSLSNVIGLPMEMLAQWLAGID